MIPQELKKSVYEANMLLPKYGLVTFTWGNVSGIDREKRLVVIKPSGVEYDKLKPEDMVVIDLDGNRVEGELNPSSDTKTHLELYKAFDHIGGIVHTHSPYAVGFAQAGEDIPCMGTTQCDYFYGNIPCIRHLTEEEIEEDYEKNTGLVIVKTSIRLMFRPVCVKAMDLFPGGRLRLKLYIMQWLWKRWLRWIYLQRLLILRQKMHLSIILRSILQESMVRMHIMGRSKNCKKKI